MLRRRSVQPIIHLYIGTVLGADVSDSNASCDDENGETQEPTNDADKPKTVEFKPYQPKYRKRGTGSVHQVSKNVWEGRIHSNSQR